MSEFVNIALSFIILDRLSLLMETLHEFNKIFTQKLSDKYDSREAESIGYMVFEHCTGMSKSQQILQGNLILGPDIKVQINKILQKLLQNVPVQYILGKTNFLEIELEIEEGVLIPRPETEELVLWAAGSLSKNDPVIVDIGTGSGCIALSLKKMSPEAKILATDISEPALQLTARNADRVKGNIEISRSNILEPGDWPKGKFDMIISNPPYIPENEFSQLSPPVRDQEPIDALAVPDDDPLVFFRALAQFGQAQLVPKGLLMAEFHSPLADDLQTLWRSLGYRDVVVKKDIHGKDRMIRALKEL